jgi:uncharacterized protein YndB with AHSA1/START domain
MRRFSTKSTIRASPERVWRILTDLQRWPAWNTTVTGVEGEVALGKKVTVRVKLAPGQAFPVKVAALEPPRRMVWRGGMPIASLFKGERTYLLTPRGSGEVEFFMEEVFDGLLAGLITRSIPDMQPAFDEFAACLKAEAERT